MKHLIDLFEHTGVKELKRQPGLKQRDRSRLPSAVTKHQPAGKRIQGRSLNILLDCYIETRAGHNA
jgi:hypothetical protein